VLAVQYAIAVFMCQTLDDDRVIRSQTACEYHKPSVNETSRRLDPFAFCNADIY